MPFIFEPRQLIRLSWLIFVSVTVPARSGQLEQPSAPAPIEVIKLKWEKQARLPQNFDPSNGGASGSINDSATSARSGGGSGSGGGGGGASTTQGMQPAAPSRVSFLYVYSMKIKNHGTKEIEGVAWDYVFLDPANSAELGRHQFLSFEKVAPDKAVTFQSEQRMPPVRTMRTQASDVNKHESLSEKSEIKCVLYADGTTWRDANAGDDVCNLLRKGKAALSRKRDH